jgi:hypothetical protein
MSVPGVAILKSLFASLNSNGIVHDLKSINRGRDWRTLDLTIAFGGSESK